MSESSDVKIVRRGGRIYIVKKKPKKANGGKKK